MAISFLNISTEIKTLTKIGKIWAKHYIEDIEEEYEKFHFAPIKEEVQCNVEHLYLHIYLHLKLTKDNLYV